MKNILSWILSLIVAVFVFCIAIILIPMQTKVVETVELTYIFVDENGNEYDIMNSNIHGAADDWSFLFDDNIEEKNSDDENNDIQTNTGHLPDKDYISDPLEMENTILDDENLEEILKEELANVAEKEENIEDEEVIIYESCITPWNNVINHGESVLAYQQRADVPTICNVQKRSCNDGELRGTYSQASCREDIKYEYTRVKVISFNNKEPGDLIQNPKYAKNDDAEFDTDGKINQIDNSANTSWNNSDNDSITSNNTTNLTHKKYYNCMSPWGEVVGHGQFIKSYESPLGFVDDKCKVELRLCLDGNLKGNYSYKTCEHKDITYQDYRAGNDDITVPTPGLMIETLVEDNSGLFNWLGGLFR